MRSLVLVLLVLCSAFLPAQAPHEAWMTVETDHFRVHYPVEYREWTLRLASRMEAIHAAVTTEVGFVPRAKADVLVMDPVAQANGTALPFLKYPRMVLWTTPPESWSPIGHYRDWPELLFLHEDVHLVHLLRPSRGGWGRFVEWMLPVGAVGRKSPRWVSEGYATYLEGKLTGVGRPNGDFRAAILRKWALEGKLPSYGQMSNDAESWMGMSMAYLMGSAYMEWLVHRSDEGAWRRLWARLTAKKDRSFDAAFEGVFGDPPAKLYDRFTADLTWRAKELERVMKPTLAEGALWQDTAWTTGEPALSPDGTRMAIVLRAKDEPSRLVVWDTRPDPEARKRWDESIERLRKEDPEDVPGVRTKPFPAKELFRMPVAAAKEPTNPRWMPDGKAILFTAYAPDADGFWSPDLYLWTPENGAVRRVTKGAHVKEADPFPDGRWAVAVQTRFGKSALAVVDLEGGTVTPVTEPSLDTVFAQPSVSRDGKRALCVRHAEGKWTLAAIGLVADAGPDATIALPDGAVPMFPSFGPHGSIFVSLGANGFINIVRIVQPEPGAGSPIRQITNSLGATIAAEPTPDGKGLYFLSLESDGLKVRYTAGEHLCSSSPDSTPDVSLAPAVRPVPPPGLAFQDEAINPPKPYGAGRQEFSFLFGGHWTSYTEAWEAGVRGGDVLGRWNYFIAGGAGRDGAPEGGTFALGWRGWPVEMTLQLYQVERAPSEQKGWPAGGIPESHGAWDRERHGLSLAFGRDWAFLRGEAEAKVGGVWERVKTNGTGEGTDRGIGYLEISGRRTRPVGPGEVVIALGVRNEWGWTALPEAGEGWTRGRVEAMAGVRRGESALLLGYERREMTGLPDTLDWFTEAITLGGAGSTLLPDAARFAEILDPAFMQIQRTGNRYEGWRVGLTVGGLPLFYQRHRLWWDRLSLGGTDDGIDLAGLEWDMTGGPLSVVRLPGFRLRLGGVYVFNPPLEDQTRFWLELHWRP
jgi:hypothetical protein